MKKLVLLPCPRAVLEHCGARAGLWTRKRKLHCPGQHIESTSAQPDLCPVPRRDDRKWRSSVAHRTSASTISTFAMGASLGSTNSVPFRFWIVAFDNASTVVLGLINCSAPTQVFPLDETGIQRSVAMTAGATSAGVFYTTNGTIEGASYPRLPRIRQ